MEIQIPEDALVILVGPAGCGKSTFARRHFEDTEIVSSDECRRLVSDEEENQAASPHAFAVFHAIVRGRLALGRLAVADATNLRSRARRELRQEAERRGRPTVAIVFDYPLSLCRARAEARSRYVSPEVIERHHEQLQHAKERLPEEGYAAIYHITARG